MSDLDRYPEDWRRGAVRDLAEQIDGQAPLPDEWAGGRWPDIRIGRRTHWLGSIDDVDGSATDSDSMSVTDLLPSLRAAFTATPHADESATPAEHAFTVFPAEDADPPFLRYFLEHHLVDLATRAQALDDGATKKQITGDDLLPLEIAIPPPEDQQRIAEILDSLDAATRRTDALLGKLQQIKFGLRDALLRRGIDRFGFLRNPVAHPEQFNDSIVGRIPTTWNPMSLDQVCLDIVDGPWSTPQYRQEGVPVATPSTIRDGAFDYASAPRVSEREYQLGLTHFTPEPGDIIFTREAPVGEAFVIPEGMRVYMSRRTVALRPNPSIALPDFVVAQLYASLTRRQMGRLTVGAVPERLDLPQLWTFPIAVPPIEEQKQILEILHTHDAWIQSERAFRAKLQLLRAGLMDDLLTGRVRVFDIQEPPTSAAAAEPSSVNAALERWLDGSFGPVDAS